jgi:hypothetical protein
MTSEQLSLLQNWMSVVFLAALVIGLLVLLIGMLKPAWVGAAGRGRVILRSLGIWLIGTALMAGTIAYTHSHENGPHSVKRYIDTYFKEQCAQGTDLPGCKQDGPSSGAAAQ